NPKKTQHHSFPFARPFFSAIETYDKKTHCDRDPQRRRPTATSNLNVLKTATHTRFLIDDNPHS
ncbi:hypothetical protein Csa_005889, partial [Cucumis sativus]